MTVLLKVLLIITVDLSCEGVYGRSRRGDGTDLAGDHFVVAT